MNPQRQEREIYVNKKQAACMDTTEVFTSQLFNGNLGNKGQDNL